MRASSRGTIIGRLGISVGHGPSRHENCEIRDEWVRPVLGALSFRGPQDHMRMKIRLRYSHARISHCIARTPTAWSRGCHGEGASWINPPNKWSDV